MRTGENTYLQSMNINWPRSVR